MDKEGTELKIWTVSAPFCDIWYINDVRYYARDATAEIEVVNEPQKNELHFCLFPSFATDFNS